MEITGIDLILCGLMIAITFPLSVWVARLCLNGLIRIMQGPAER